jgi:TrmH family RNA methyltransferase
MTDSADPSLAVTLANPRADRVRGVRSLAGKSVRERSGRFLVEGPQGVREAVRFAADRVRDVYVAPDDAGRHPEIVGEAREAGIHVHGCTDEVVGAMSKDAQGVLAVVDLASPSLDGAFRGGARLAVILSNVRDPGNLGTIVRAADAAGADAVVLVGDCVDPHSPKVVRATAGSLFHLPVATGARLEDAIVRARRAGLEVFAATGSGSDDLFSLADEGALAGPIAWVFGNEAWGLSEAEAALADRSVRIPISGNAESLNVASAASVALFFCAHARRDHGEDPG